MSDLSSLFGFEKRAPSHQNALGIFDGSWVSMFPPSSGLQGGQASHFDDSRVPWAASILGGLNGKSILELGPFEAYNTFQFQMAGASGVVSIESSRINFLKCLVVKNVFGLSATFLHGDFQPFLAQTASRFDICWASGVLYHLTDPLAMLVNMRRVANSAFVWTQYFDEALLRSRNNFDFFDPARNKVVEFGGRTVTLHHRNYQEQAGMVFSGGEDNYSYWMTKQDIMFVLAQLGYDEIHVGVDNPDHPPGPAMFFVARASGPAAA